MATFQENIRKIRGEAVYGPDMREAIAESLTQAIDLDIAGEGLVLFSTIPIPGTRDDYRLLIVNDGTSNILENVAWVDGKYLDANGAEATSGPMHYSSLIPLSGVDTYRLSFTPAGSTLRTIRIHGYDEHGDWVKQLTYVSSASMTSGTPAEVRFVADGCKYARVSIATAYENVYLRKTTFA